MILQHRNEISLPSSWRLQPLSAFNAARPSTIDPAGCPDETFEYYSIPAYQDCQRPAFSKGNKIGSAKLLLDPGTVLFGKLNPRVEKVWRVGNHSLHRKIGSTEWLPLVPPEGTDGQFLYFLMWSEHVMPKAKRLVSGSTPSRQRVDPSSFYRIEAPLPPLGEQRKIAVVLGSVQQAMEQQERLLALTVELKKALLHQLFTHGLRREPQKQTELGPIPQSWEVARVEELVTRGVLAKPLDGNHGNIHPKSDDFVGEGIPFIMASDLKDGGIDLTGCAHLRKEQADKLQKGFAREGDVLISHKATIGVTAMVPPVEHYVMLTPQVTYYRVLDKNVLNNVYLKTLFDSPLFQTPFRRVATDGSTRDYIGITKQRSLFLVLPPLEEQMEIAATVSAAEQKAAVHRRKHAALSALFRTLLHELMIARIRVHNLDLVELEAITAS
jgi:type I restriction enzyme S subunit